MTHRERMEAVLRGERPDYSTALDKAYAAYGFGPTHYGARPTWRIYGENLRRFLEIAISTH